MSASKFAVSALIALASVAATSAAFAESSADRNYPETASVSTKTRADVQAELAQARKDGTLLIGNDNNYPVIAEAASTKTREQVMAEYVAARNAGQIPVEHS
jgi:hypothetical protein